MARTPATTRGSLPGPSDSHPVPPPVIRPTAALGRATTIARGRLAGLPDRDVDVFVSRLERWWPDLLDGWAAPYGGHIGGEAALDRLVEQLADRYRERSEPLKVHDLGRSLRPDWFADPSMIGYVFYVDRFAGTLAGVEAHLDHLAELGVRYVHLMPLLRPRGGYAVADYRAVDPALGTMMDLEALCGRLRDLGISVCVDLVLNHTAAEHEWARQALAGDPWAEAMYRIYPDRTMPDRYEATLPEVFPTFAPGNFTRIKGGRWVWTTFNTYQWDLDWSNPQVFLEMTDVLLNLANRGVDVVRLDAVAFMWKRLGTNCQNQPEVHDLLQALRACARIAAPAVIFKAEAIVGPDQLAQYLGVGRHHGRVADLAYHNTLMVLFWSSLAAGDTRLMTHVLREFPRKPVNTAWATYIRCHDDIGWAVTETDAAAVGWDGPGHRAFLSAFYTGRFRGSYARGEGFQINPETGDQRVSGTFASLAGLEAALDRADPTEVTKAIERILLGHALILGWDGIPLLYMGDEIGLLNDRSYLAEPEHAADNRWLHRPRMDWLAASRRHDPATVEGRIFEGLRALIATRRRTPQLSASAPLRILDGLGPGVFGFVREHPLGWLTALHGFADVESVVDPTGLPQPPGGILVDLLDGSRRLATRPIVVPPRGVLWLVAAVGPG